MSTGLRVAVVHYHLKRGGVTRVIESTLRGLATLRNPPECAVMTGALSEDPALRPYQQYVDGLDYVSSRHNNAPSPAELLRRLRSHARRALGGPPDIWHIHNHALGKNTALPGVVSLLADAGEALLLHMHDFAEDGRPENYRTNQAEESFAARLYPHGPAVHYGVLNGRDYEILRAAGISPACLHLLSNPVEGARPGASAPDRTAAIRRTLGAEQLTLYPVRAVRRKNFGEMLLWAALADEGNSFATTLNPTNPNYQAGYMRWKRFARAHDLPVRFGIGEDYDWAFAEIVESASSILSTSIAEGFGLAFLEPWLFGKPLIGRDLPAITQDFKAKGVALPSLYAALPVPVDWIDHRRLCDTLLRNLKAVYGAYQTPLPDDALQRALAAVTPAPGFIDFSALDESMQETVVAVIARNPSLGSELPNLPKPANPELIGANASVIARHYSLSSYAEGLMDLYTTLAETEPQPVDYLNPARVLREFLKPEAFRLLRT